MNEFVLPLVADDKFASRRSFYAAKVSDFLMTPPAAVIGALARRHVAFHRAAEGEQIRSWEAEITLLRRAFEAAPESVEESWLLLEKPLLRLGLRLDAILLSPGVVAVIEFKIGAKTFASGDLAQLENYVAALKDFHQVSQTRLVVPILCAELAQNPQFPDYISGGVADVLCVNGAKLATALQHVARWRDRSATPLDAEAFDASPYRPTPTIVEAAQALYAGHNIAEIGRGDAADESLQQTAEKLRALAAEAQREQKRIICFVTGAPGAGKTLLGLDLALKGRDGVQPSALLSGNRPLVHVLTVALAQDQAKRGSCSKAEAKRQVDGAIQNLQGYLNEYKDGGAPPEHVLVYDEAQRAWNADVGQKLMGRAKSEPALFLEIFDRLAWGCLVCLVGPGQEINRGEGGLALWAEALAEAGKQGSKWEIVAAPTAIDGGEGVTGNGLAAGADLSLLHLRRDRALHLANAIRSYRNPWHGEWVKALLASDLDGAAQLAQEMAAPPAYLTRDLAQARNWLRRHRRGGYSTGLLCSSGAVRLVAEGLPPAPQSGELNPIGNWFLKPNSDFRSGGALEVPLSEYGCQGLEMDFIGLCWGGDLIWQEGAWRARKMFGPSWRMIRGDERQQFRLNSYRVLLTRARAGAVIMVPRGDDEDATRAPREFDRIAEALTRAGCEELMTEI